jgi:hypothetical protein
VQWDGNGGVGGDWSDPLNWSTNGLPGTNDTAQIDANCSDAFPVLLSTPQSVGVVQVGYAGTGYLRIGNDLTVGRSGNATFTGGISLTLPVSLPDAGSATGEMQSSP